MQNGFGTYFEKIKRFTWNARMMLVYSAIMGTAFGAFRLLSNFYILSLGYNEGFVGRLTSFSSLAGLVAMFPAVYLADRFSQKRIMVVAGVVSALGFLGFVAFPYYPTLILFNIVAGLAQSVGAVAASPFLMWNTSEDERQYVFSLSFGFVTLTQVIGNVLGGWLPGPLGSLLGVGPTDSVAYRLTLGAMTLISLLAVSPLMAIRGGRPDSGHRAEMPWTLFWRHWVILVKLLLPNLILGLGAGLMMPFMNLFYRDIFGLSDLAVGGLFTFDGGVMFIAQFIGPVLADRRGKIGAVVLTQALSVPFLVTLGVSAWVMTHGNGNGAIWFVIAALAYLARLGLMNLGGPIYQTFAMEQVEENAQALTASLNNMAFTAGWAVSPSVGGYLLARYDSVGFIPIFFSTAALYTIGIALTWLLFRHAEKPRLQPEPGEVCAAAR